LHQSDAQSVGRFRQVRCHGQDLAELLDRCGKLTDVLERADLGHPRFDVSSTAQRAER
jgi:hypothetical protein